MLFIGQALFLLAGSPSVSSLDLLSYQESIICVRDLLQDISEKTHKKYMCSSDLADRKVTVCCNKLPSEKVRTALASVLGAQWREYTSATELTLKREFKNLEASALDDEKLHLEKSLREAVSSLVRLRNFTEEDRRRQQLKVDAETRELRRRGVTEDSDEMLLLNQRRFLYSSPGLYPLGESFRGHESEVVSRLMGGRTVVLSTGSGRTALPLGQEFFHNDQLTVGKGKHVDGFSLIHMREQGKRLSIPAIAYGSSSTNAIGWCPILRFSPPLKDLKIQKKLREWAAVSDRKVIDTPLVATSSDSLAKLDYVYNFASTGDQLVDLYRRSGVPIIADAFRLTASERKPFPGATVGEWVGAFNKSRILNSMQYRPGYVRTEDGWLMYRHEQYWSKLEAEIPEKQLKSLENKFVKVGLNLDDYADFASRISRVQFDGFEGFILVRFPARPLRYNRSLLLFWESLSASQRRKSAEDGLIADELDAAQRLLFLEVLTDMPSNSAGSSAFDEALGHLIDETPSERPFIFKTKFEMGEPQMRIDDESGLDRQIKVSGALTQISIFAGDERGLTQNLELPLKKGSR